VKTRLLVTAALVIAASGMVACKKRAAQSESPPPGASWTGIPKATLPPDVTTPSALLNDPKLQAGGMNGVRVKVHGYATVLSAEKVSIGEAADKNIPFVFCKGKVPPGLPSKAHVLAEGTFDDMGNLADCTVSPL
jgi:hypothetical protein